MFRVLALGGIAAVWFGFGAAAAFVPYLLPISIGAGALWQHDVSKCVGRERRYALILAVASALAIPVLSFLFETDYWRPISATFRITHEALFFIGAAGYWAIQKRRRHLAVTGAPNKSLERSRDR